MYGDLSLKFVCEKCGHHETVLIGTGWNGPFAKDVISDVCDGKYGERWQKLFQNTPGAEVDERMELYVCPSCRSFRNEINLTIYKPKKPEEISPETKIPYLTAISKYKCVNKLLSLQRARHYWDFGGIAYIHRCDQCGRRMHLYKEGEQLHCPRCANGWMKEEEHIII